PSSRPSRRPDRAIGSRRSAAPIDPRAARRSWAPGPSRDESPSSSRAAGRRRRFVPGAAAVGIDFDAIDRSVLAINQAPIGCALAVAVQFDAAQDALLEHLPAID